MPPERKVNPVVATIIIVVLVVGITVGIILLQNMNTATTEPSTTTTTDTNTTQTVETSDDTAPSYADGEYTATGSYSTPGGSEDITVTVTLADDVITAVSADGSATSGNSASYQKQFLSGYETLVVGKDIDTVSLSRVSGSSLTSNGFNEALDMIKADATA